MRYYLFEFYEIYTSLCHVAIGEECLFYPACHENGQHGEDDERENVRPYICQRIGVEDAQLIDDVVMSHGEEP